MLRYIGYLVGFVWLGLAYGAYSSAMDGIAAGRPDWGFWWKVVSALLAIAGTGAILGTFVNARQTRS